MYLAFRLQSLLQSPELMGPQTIWGTYGYCVTRTNCQASGTQKVHRDLLNEWFPSISLFFIGVRMRLANMSLISPQLKKAIYRSASYVLKHLMFRESLGVLLKGGFWFKVGGRAEILHLCQTSRHGKSCWLSSHTWSSKGRNSICHPLSSSGWLLGRGPVKQVRLSQPVWP